MSRKWQRVLSIIPFLLAVSGCATFTHSQPSLLQSNSKPWFCEGQIQVTHAGRNTDTMKHEAEAIVYPSKDIEKLEVDLNPAISQSKTPCSNGASCQSELIGGVTRINIQPAKPTHPSPEKSPGMMFYSEGIQFDPTNSRLTYDGGGFEWGWEFTGKCVIKP